MVLLLMDDQLLMMRIIRGEGLGLVVSKRAAAGWKAAGRAVSSILGMATDSSGHKQFCKDSVSHS